MLFADQFEFELNIISEHLLINLFRLVRKVASVEPFNIVKEQLQLFYSKLLLTLNLVIHNLDPLEVFRDFLQGILVIYDIYDEVSEFGSLKISVIVFVDLAEELAAFFV